MDGNVNLRNYKRKKDGLVLLGRKIFWCVISRFFINTSFPWPYILKVAILRFFGAKIGKKIVIKPHVNIKYPWFLSVGDNSWIGEYVWIDNLVDVNIGKNVCISQSAYLLTGNHDYKSKTFDLMAKKIVLEDGVWICAKSIVCPGIVCKRQSILSAGSVATKSLNENAIYQGNPAVFIRNRKIR